MVHGADGQQRRYGCMGGVHTPVGQDDVVHSIIHGLFRLPAQSVQGGQKSRPAFRHVEKHGQLDSLETFVPDVAQYVELGVVQHRMRQPDHLAMLLVRHEYLHPDCPDVFRQGHYKLFPYRVDGGVCDLGELLAEIIEQQLRLFRKDGQRSVVAHGCCRFRTVRAHGDDYPLYILTGIAEVPQHHVIAADTVFDFPSALEGVELYPVL